MRFRSHYWPRTRVGVVALGLFGLMFVLAEPPILYAVANRIEPFVLGVPFLYGYLLVVYTAWIGVLLWMHRRGV